MERQQSTDGIHGVQVSRLFVRRTWGILEPLTAILVAVSNRRLPGCWSVSPANKPLGTELASQTAVLSPLSIGLQNVPNRVNRVYGTHAHGSKRAGALLQAMNAIAWEYGRKRKPLTLEVIVRTNEFGTRIVSMAGIVLFAVGKRVYSNTHVTT